jgi:hypothetical protein
MYLRNVSHIIRGHRLSWISAILVTLAVGSSGCIYIPLGEISPPNEHSWEWQKELGYPTTYLDVRHADRWLKPGMSREDVHAMIGLPDHDEDVPACCRHGGPQHEYYSFAGTEAYFYILTKSLFGFDDSGILYILTVDYDIRGHLVKITKCRAPGIGIFGL